LGSTISTSPTVRELAELGNAFAAPGWATGTDTGRNETSCPVARADRVTVFAPSRYTVEASVVTTRVSPNSVTTLTVVAVRLEMVPLFAKANCPKPIKGRFGPEPSGMLARGTGIALEGAERVADAWLAGDDTPDPDAAEAIP